MITLARMRTHVPKWDSSRYSEFKDMRRGAAEDAFWDENELVEYRSKREKKTRKRRPGCPANDGKGHVYVWDTVTRRYWGFDNRWHAYTWKRLVCCGCEKLATYRMRRRWK